MRPFLDRHSIAPLAVVAAAGVIAFALRYLKIKRLFLRKMPRWIKILPASPEQFPALDIEAFQRYTSELETLGFVVLLDYTFESDANRENLSSLGRVFVHADQNCFAEVHQVFSGGISRTAVGCTIISTMDDGWGLSSRDGEPRGAMYALRAPKDMWTAHPGTTPSELFTAHLERRNQIAGDLGLRISADLSERNYFSTVERDSLESRKAFKRRNVLLFMLEMDRFERHPKYEWLGDRSKLSNRVSVPDAV